MNTPFLIRKLYAAIVLSFIRVNILLIALSHQKNKLKALDAVKALAKRRVAFSGIDTVPKFFYAGGRFFFNPNIPGWPSPAFRKFIVNELFTLSGNTDNYNPRLTTVIFSITGRCNLGCKHCFEWDRLNNNEHLSENELHTILKKFQQYGVSQLQLGGGEPMMRFEDLINVIKKSQKGTDFWLLTSGYGLTREKAAILKKSGLTGVKISLDHWDKKMHNEFRGSEKAFDWAVQAVMNCKAAGLATGISACIIREFLSEDFLFRYINFARGINADFVFFLEPRETGHFNNVNVTLTDNEICLLEKFYLNINSSPGFARFPLIIFPGYHQRRIGCYGAGQRFLYVDSEGSIHACPFCQGKLGDALRDDLELVIPELRKVGCHMFH